MLEKLVSKFSLDAVRFTRSIFVCMVVIWLMVVGCAVSSIWSQGFTRRQRVFWIILVVCVPVLGLLVYLPFSVRKEDNAALSFLFPGGLGAKKK